jgi:N-sulfoglucosamine sulfohydrolase
MRLSVLCLAGLFLTAGPVAAQDKPRNVVLLIADDLGLELGCYGNAVIKTPHLDALARRGTRFTNAYANVSSCSPSRSVILTGLYNHTNGQYGLAHAAHHQHTHPWVRSLSHLLRLAGYFTGLIGKFHLLPLDAYPFDRHVEKGLGGNRDVAAIAREARAFIKASGTRPFFLVIGYGDPHRTKAGFGNELRGNDPAEVKYDPATLPLPYFLPDRPEVRQELAAYYQSVSRLDRGVGLILEMLKELGHDEDTLILFLSDNGIPFPGGKTTLYDAGLHLPLLIAAPTQKRRGHPNHAMCSWVDVTPTILDWAKVKGPAYKLPGRSLLPILDEENPPGWDAVFGSHQFHEITMYYPMRSVRTRQYSYIVNLAHRLDYPLASDLHDSPTWQGVLRRGDKMLGERGVEQFLRRPRAELYDLRKDPKELRNVANDPAHAQALAELRRRLRAWQEETRDPWLILYRDEKAAVGPGGHPE